MSIEQSAKRLECAGKEFVVVIEEIRYSPRAREDPSTRLSASPRLAR